MVRLSTLDRARARGVLQGGQTIVLLFLDIFVLILLSPKAFVSCLFSLVHYYCPVNHWSFTGK